MQLERVGKKDMEKLRKYRVNESEHFNLLSMNDKLHCMLYDAQDANDFDKIDEIEKRLEEVNSLLEDAYCVGALVTWEQLKRIREIRDERNMIRYQTAIESGASECDAGYAFM